MPELDRSRVGLEYLAHLRGHGDAAVRSLKTVVEVARAVLHPPPELRHVPRDVHDVSGNIIVVAATAVIFVVVIVV